MKEDCFGYNPKGKTIKDKCMALTLPYCNGGGHCPFYKTKEQHEKELREHPLIDCNAYDRSPMQFAVRAVKA